MKIRDICLYYICEWVWEKGPYGQKLRYFTSMPNFKCQNNLKVPKRVVESKATFILFCSRSTINGE